MYCDEYDCYEFSVRNKTKCALHERCDICFSFGSHFNISFENDDISIIICPYCTNTIYLNLDILSKYNENEMGGCYEYLKLLDIAVKNKQDKMTASNLLINVSKNCLSIFNLYMSCFKILTYDQYLKIENIIFLNHKQFKKFMKSEYNINVKKQQINNL